MLMEWESTNALGRFSNAHSVVSDATKHGLPPSLLAGAKRQASAKPKKNTTPTQGNRGRRKDNKHRGRGAHGRGQLPTPAQVLAAAIAPSPADPTLTLPIPNQQPKPATHRNTLPISSDDDLDDPGASFDELSAEDTAIIAAIQREDAEAEATRAARRKQLMQI
eukprot:4528569-Pleurochrysis_carterae.AAC.2